MPSRDAHPAIQQIARILAETIGVRPERIGDLTIIFLTPENKVGVFGCSASVEDAAGLLAAGLHRLLNGGALEPLRNDHN